MKEKRTYINLKEHGEDMSHENEVTIKNEDRGPGDLTFLIEQHRKEIWEWKQKEAKWIQTANTLEGAKQVINELSARLTIMSKRIQELEFDKKTYKSEIEKLLAEKNK